MRLAVVALLCVGVAAGRAAATVDADASRRITASAEELLRIEKKIAASNEDLGAILYEDVLSLIDSAIDADPDNLHAHALAAGVLLLKSDQGDGTFDVCPLLDARDEAAYVIARASHAAAADLASSHGVLREIARIPRAAIPDPPSSCEDDEDQHHGSKAGFKGR